MCVLHDQIMQLCLNLGISNTCDENLKARKGNKDCDVA